jgi:high-affinity iron transporter
MWADAIPNLLIGLREGLEAGLVVSILLAALRKTGDGRASAAPVWLGVLGAVMLAGSFAAVLTYSAGVLSSRAQEAVGGLLSVLAVGLVTTMVFWMRRTAAGLAAHLRGEVQRAVATVQERLAGEPLIDYVQPFGGGYFFTLPGVVDGTDWFGRSLLA